MPEITAITPHGPGGQLGAACNRAMEYAPTEWVLLHDEDVLLKLHPNWRALCETAIELHPDVGLFTCWTNSIGRPKHTKEPLVPPDAPGPLATVSEHIEMARRIWEQHGYNVTPLTDVQVGGFFHLTSKTAWLAAGGYPGRGQFDEDHGYCRALKAAGLAVARIDGLYVYHMGSIRGHREHSWMPGEKTARELWESLKRDK